jgi:SAM-dependent methyltransferase
LSLTDYDRVAYPSQPIRQTHPERLAAAAVLLGAPHVPMARARVLEIGCGEGGNIIPLAAAYPDATVVGFDLASSAIAAGQRVVDQLGLGNIRLETLDILAAGPELGEFDYIIAHGVYSWVPAPVREALLRLIGERLAPAGLAFVSFNALPGCHVRLALREMLLHHLGEVEGFEPRLAGARAFLELLISSLPDDSPAALAMKSECQRMLTRDPRVLFHDELGPVYAPCHLHEFVADAAGQGLQFVADAESLWWREELFPSDLGRKIAALIGGDSLDLQQYLDFVAARFFRQAILARAEAPLSRPVDPARVRALWATAPAKPLTPDADLVGPTPVTFNLGGGTELELDEPALKQMLHRLGQSHPRGVAVAELPPGANVDEALLQLFTMGKVQLASGPAPMSLQPGERPVASPLARLQVSEGQPNVTTLDHGSVRLSDEAGRAFVMRLDGARTREELARDMSAFGPAVSVEQVDAHLVQLARLGLLAA